MPRLRLLFSLLIVYSLSWGSPIIPSGQYTVASDLTTFVSEPGKLLSKQPLWAWTIPTAILYLNDASFTAWYEARKPDFDLFRGSHWVSDRGIYDGIKWAFLFGTVAKDEKILRFAYCAGESVLDACFIAQGLKHLTGRSRPVLTTDDPYQWGHVAFNATGPYTSFPSSHATIYFSVGTILGKTMENEWLGDGIAAISYFSLTGHNHWTSDMWIGYLLGKSIGNYVWDRNQGKDLTQQWFIYPTFENPDDSLFPAIGIWIMF